MKRSFVFLFIFTLLSSTSTILAEEAALKFPGKFTLDFLQRFDFDIVNNKPMVNPASVPSEGDMYERTEFKLGLIFDIHEMYSLGVSVKDRFDIKFNGINTPNVIQILPRNRFFFNLDNTVKVPKIINIGVNFELRQQTDINKEVTNDNSIPEESIEVRLSPVLVLNGKYDFGFSFNIVQYINFYLYPTYYNFGGDVTPKVFKKTELEGFYYADFEFFHFFAPKEIKGAVYVDDYLVVGLNGEKWIVDPIKNLIKDASTDLRTTGNIFNEFTIGMKFDIFKLTPFIGFYLKNADTFDNDPDTKSDNVWIGTKMGLGYSKEWFSIGITYLGRYQVWKNGKSITEKAAPADLKPIKDGIQWENHIETFVKFSLK